MKNNFILITIFILLLLAGCKVGRKYHEPNLTLPQKFSEQKDASQKADLSSWWTFFQDPYLNKLIEKALAQNYDLRIAIEKIKEMRATYRIQNAKLYPEIDGTGSVLANQISKKLIQNSYLLTSKINYFQLGFDCLWEIDFWGKQQAARDGTYNQYEAQIEDMRDVYIMLLSDVTKTYIDIKTLQKKIDLLQKQIDLDTKLLFLSKDRFQSGIASDIPDFEQLAELDESQNQLIILQTTIKQTINSLAVLLGENPEQFNFQEGSHTVPQSTKALGIGLPSELLKRRPDIRQAERQLAASGEFVKQAVAEWFPSISLLGIVDTQANTGNNLFSNNSVSWSFGPSFRLPIITFGRIRFNVQAKKSAEKQALLAYCQSVVSAFGDVENWLVSYFNNKDRKKILEEKVFAATKERDLIKYLFECGLDSQTQYLLAEKNLVSIELEFTDSEQSVSNSLISVYKSLGGGW
jgi:NodT family efflux transporter outer membrane factor (OMF) lipoprotein